MLFGIYVAVEGEFVLVAVEAPLLEDAAGGGEKAFVGLVVALAVFAEKMDDGGFFPDVDIVVV